MSHTIASNEAIAESKSLIDFVANSPSAFHVVDNLKRKLIDNGFEQLDLRNAWNVKTGGRYFLTFNGTFLVAFHLSDDIRGGNGFRMIASHSDSPTFRIKPNNTSRVANATRLSVETYGGAILYSWLDRPISLAGRVILRSDDPMRPASKLVDFKRPIGVIPSVAIHFNRNVNDGFAFNKQVDMQILAQASSSLQQLVVTDYLSQLLDIESDSVLDFDLYAYDTTPGSIAGFDNSLLICPKQDNLTMAYESFLAFVDTLDSNVSKMLIVLDNEEVGSGTKQGAASPLVKNVLERICSKLCLDVETSQRVVYNSFLVSADMAHAIHPNHPELSDPANYPVLNGGPVIKYNANQKYMTDADGAAVFKLACQKANVPCQSFVNRSDIPGGSTLGNIMTSQLPLRGVDVGNPMLAMHSCCETGGTQDPIFLRLALRQFMSQN